MTYSPFYFSPQSTGTSIAIVTNYYNNTGSAIAQGVAVSKTGTADQIAPTDPTSDTSVHAFVGFAQFHLPNATLGPIISSGRLETLTGYSFSLGQSIWIGLNGVIQNTRPDYAVTGFATGDFIMYAGVIVQNELNPINQDLLLMPQLVGEL